MSGSDAGSILPEMSGLREAFFYLHISAGHVGLPIIVFSFLYYKSLSRHPTLINFCMTWIIVSISYCITSYSGQSLNDTQSAACRAQAVFVQGTPPMAVTACLIVVVELWFTLWRPCQVNGQITNNHFKHNPRLYLVILTPYLVCAVYVIIALAMIQVHPDAVSGANGLFCTVFTTTPHRYAVSGYCSALIVIILALEVSIAVRFFRLRLHITRAFPLAERHGPSTSMVLRVGLFSVYSMITFGASLQFLTGQINSLPYMVQACLPLMALLIFGSQKDIFITWRRCKWKRQVCPLEGQGPSDRRYSESITFAQQDPSENLPHHLRLELATTPTTPTFGGDVHHAQTDLSESADLLKPPDTSHEDSEGSTVGSDLTFVGQSSDMGPKAKASPRPGMGSAHSFVALPQLPEPTHARPHTDGRRVSWSNVRQSWRGCREDVV
ncbi:hypothetical protein BDV98DRAFT_558846 [Pterulicium gracile]|uniref:G-protein coupled receptors family 1 profile domain-containing protein n=1 Tax=Pterulicium gracile TaxID=1884261 RepID=A0A5C3QXJ9_9AGAR|nr:hypothetical protein BDV98DRAFT_558846 [Pterula gracilis]